MTLEQNHRTIGSLIARHKASRDIIQGLREPHGQIAQQLRDLSRMANDHESTIGVTPEGFTSGYGEKPIPLDILDSFSETLGKLQAVRDEKQRIETCLKEMGMNDHIPWEENMN